jgi:RimJ/RimL family protein N-acetyltransferase
MPFSIPWTRQPPALLQREALKHWWGQRAAWTPESWSFTGAVIVDGEAAGVQDLAGHHFGVTRAAGTGSWLGQRFQGQGIGKEMRAAVLHLLFAGLGGVVAYSGAFEDNGPSLGVSRSLGYVENGDELFDREGAMSRQVKLKLDRSVWEQHRRDDIEIDGLDACLDWFGAG